MKQRTNFVVFTVAILLFSSGFATAVENKPDTSQKAATQADASPKNTQSGIDAKHKQVVKIKLVDINSAKKSDLKKLPGINDAEADKIIASRPFGSKAWLVSHGVIPMLTYQAIKGMVICKLTQKDIDTIMAKAEKNKSKK